jgi:hypothetical protein
MPVLVFSFGEVDIFGETDRNTGKIRVRSTVMDQRTVQNQVGHLKHLSLPVRMSANGDCLRPGL